MADNIASGVSYVRNPEYGSEDRMPPWFTASDPHGTYMAHLIGTVNPECELHSYRVGTYRRDIDSKTAARVSIPATS